MIETLLFAFANSSSDPLPDLEAEYNKLIEILASRKKRGDFHLEALPFSSPEQITKFIGSNLEDLVIFHYSGHADSGSLLLNDQSARSEGIAHLLCECERLHVVVLNGCSTKGQVEALINKVPVVISTNAPVEDESARLFSTTLYEAMEKGHSLEKAFKLALGAAETKKPIEVYRGIDFHSLAPNEPLWGISYREERHLEFTLPRKKLAVHLRSDLASVSCDRKSIINRFDTGFERAEESGQTVVLFLLLEQPYGEVESLVKRLITNLAETRKGVKYAGYENILIETVEMDGTESLQDGQILFRKAFNRHVSAHQVRSLKEFATMLPIQFPLFGNASYIPFAFKLKAPSTAWDVLVAPLMRWAITDFLSAPDPTVPKRMYICFFILELTSTKKGKVSEGGFWGGLFGQNKPLQDPDAGLYAQLESLAGSYPPLPVTILPRLTKVDRRDLDDWYRQFEDNQALRDKLVDQLVQKLPKSETWNMSDVEAELRKIVEAHRNRERGI